MPDETRLRRRPSAGEAIRRACTVLVLLLARGLLSVPPTNLAPAASGPGDDPYYDRHRTARAVNLDALGSCPRCCDRITAAITGD